MGKSAPTPPDPMQVAHAQTASDIGTAIANAYIGNADTTTPFGSVDYKRTGVQDVRIGSKHYQVPTFSVNQRLSPDQQQLLNLQESAGINLGKTAVSESEFMRQYLGKQFNPDKLPDQVTDAAQAGNLVRAQSPEDFSADRQRIANDMYARINPQIDRDRASLQTRLANQGVTQGSEAYNNAIDELNRQITDQRTQVDLTSGQEQDRLYKLAMDKANQQNAVIQGNYENQSSSQQQQNVLRQQAFQEAMALRNQPLSEVSQLLNGSSPTIPQFQPFNAPHVSDTPVGQYMYQTANLQNQQYMAQMQQGNAAMGGMFGLGSSLAGLFFSDRRLKENIRRLGAFKSGLAFYAYNFKGAIMTSFGVMADEVERVMPEAVVTHPSGFKMVDYGLATQEAAR